MYLGQGAFQRGYKEGSSDLPEMCRKREIGGTPREVHLSIQKYVFAVHTN